MRTHVKLLLLMMIIPWQMLNAKTEKWTIDSSHSKIGFEISHLIISSVEGRFRSFSGEITFDPSSPNKAKEFSVSAEIDPTSIDTGIEKRDKHLRSADFFDVTKHKKMTFVSKKVTFSKENKMKVVGDLTLAGKTKSVELEVSFLGTADAYDVKRVAFKATTKIIRQDFGLTWNDGETKSTNFAGKIAEASGAVGDEVEIELSIQAKRLADL